MNFRASVFIVAILAATPALAIDFSQPILDASGKPAHEGKDDTSPILTLGSAISAALFVPPQPQQPGRPGTADTQDPVKLAKRAALGIRLRDAKDADITADEVVEIKQAITVFPPVTVLRVLQAIDPASLK